MTQTVIKLRLDYWSYQFLVYWYQNMQLVNMTQTCFTLVDSHSSAQVLCCPSDLIWDCSNTVFLPGPPVCVTMCATGWTVWSFLVIFFFFFFFYFFYSHIYPYSTLFPLTVPSPSSSHTNKTCKKIHWRRRLLTRITVCALSPLWVVCLVDINWIFCMLKGKIHLLAHQYVQYSMFSHHVVHSRSCFGMRC